MVDELAVGEETEELPQVSVEHEVVFVLAITLAPHTEILERSSSAYRNTRMMHFRYV